MPIENERVSILLELEDVSRAIKKKLAVCKELDAKKASLKNEIESLSQQKANLINKSNELTQQLKNEEEEA